MASKRKVTKQECRTFATTGKRTKTDEGGDTSSEKEPAKFFTLSAELRNYIYELVLVAPREEIRVTSDLKPPGLLAANRQIRSECRKIWYFQNKFVFPVSCCDAKLLGPFMELTMTVETPSTPSVRTSILCHSDLPHWANLVEWCQTVHEYGCSMQEGQDEFETVIVAAHGIAMAHRNGSWEDCLQALESLRLVAGMVDESWLDDRDDFPSASDGVSS